METTPPPLSSTGRSQALKELPPDLRGPAGREDRPDRGRAQAVSRDRPPRIEIHEAPEVIGMGEKPLTAIRKKRKSSIVVGLGCRRPGSPTPLSPPAIPARCSPPAPSCSGCTTASSGRPWPRSFPPPAAPPSCSMPAPTSIVPPRSWSASPTSARCTPGTCWASPSRSSGCSTSARKKRRATRSSRKPTCCSSQASAAQLHRQHRRARYPRRPCQARVGRRRRRATASSATSCSSSTSRWRE